ncbi:MAG: hypothetical protein R2700_12980 [Solirubrobacterales bacterium]
MPTYMATGAAIDVLLRVRTDRVCEPALLADLAEQPGGGGTAEDRVHHAEGEAAVVVARDPGRPEADVVLLGLLRVEAEPRLMRRSVPVGSDDLALSRLQMLLDEFDDAVVLEAARRRDDDVGAAVAGLVVGGDVRDRDRADHLGGPEHPAAQRVLAEDRVGEHVVDAVGGLVLVHRDLLDHDLPLGVDVREGRLQEHLGEQVERGLGVLVEEPREEVGRLLARRRVRGGAELRRSTRRSRSPSTGRCP